MRITFKLKTGASITNVVSALHDVITTGAANAASAGVDGTSVTIQGTYAPRVAYDAANLFIELGSGAVVSLAYGSSGFVLKEYRSFDWTTLTGVSTTASYENSTATANVTNINYTALLGLSAVTVGGVFTLNITTRHVFISAVGPLTGSAVTLPVSPLLAYAFRIAASAPADVNRFDGLTSAKTLIFCWNIPAAEARYGTAGGSPAQNSQAVLNVLVSYTGGAVDSLDGTISSAINPIVVLAPGGEFGDLNGELFLVVGRRGLGEVFTSGLRTWISCYYGHFYQGYAGNPFFDHTIFCEVV